MGWYLGHKGLLAPPPPPSVPMSPVFAHFSKFSMYAWGKKRKLLVFTAVYVCVKAKLTLVRFFFIFFFLHLSLNRRFDKWLTRQAVTVVLAYDALHGYNSIYDDAFHGHNSTISQLTTSHLTTSRKTTSQLGHVILYSWNWIPYKTTSQLAGI